MWKSSPHGTAISSAREASEAAPVHSADDLADEVAVEAGALGVPRSRLPQRRLRGQQSPSAAPSRAAPPEAGTRRERGDRSGGQAGGARACAPCPPARTPASRRRPGRRGRARRGRRGEARRRPRTASRPSRRARSCSPPTDGPAEGSASPAQRSTTSRPFVCTATAAPSSSPSPKFRSKASATGAKSGSQNPPSSMLTGAACREAPVPCYSRGDNQSESGSRKALSLPVLCTW